MPTSTRHITDSTCVNHSISSREILEIDLDDIVGPGGQNIGLEFLKQDQYVSKSWMLIASEHLRQGRVEMAERTLVEGLGGEYRLGRGNQEKIIHLISSLYGTLTSQSSSNVRIGMECATPTLCSLTWPYHKPRQHQKWF